METYTLILKRRWWFNRKLKNVVGHDFPIDMNPGFEIIQSLNTTTGEMENIRQRLGRVKFMAIYFKDKSREIVNLDHYAGYPLGLDYYDIDAQKIFDDSQGKVDIRRRAS